MATVNELKTKLVSMRPSKNLENPNDSEEFKTFISNGIDSVIGNTDEEKRHDLRNLPKLTNLVIDILTKKSGASNFDIRGTTVRPILNRLCKEKLAELPQEEPEEI